MNTIIEKAQVKPQFKRMALFPTQFTIDHPCIQITQITGQRIFRVGKLSFKRIA